MIKENSKWSGEDKCFIVLYTVEVDGHVWVHYRSEYPGPAGVPLEYSCYQESFESRFRLLPE
jgi:hypothetical protein